VWLFSDNRDSKQRGNGETGKWGNRKSWLIKLMASMEVVMQEYTNDKITIRYDENVCIHAGKCVQGLPQVFDVNQNPWINVSGADVEAIKRTIKQCPSGALTLEEKK
jgi:uncharacterized Fe-S cluster protein YjdI